MKIEKKEKINKALANVVNKALGLTTADVPLETLTLQEVLGPNFIDHQIYQDAVKYTIQDGTHGLKIPIQKSTTANSEVVPQFLAEGVAYEADKYQFAQLSLVPSKFTIPIPITNEMIEDQTAFGAFVAKESSRLITLGVSRAMIYGNGNIEGVIDSAAYVETSEADYFAAMDDMMSKYSGGPKGKFYVGSTAYNAIITNWAADENLAVLIVDGVAKLFYGVYEIVNAWDIMDDVTDMLLGDFSQYVIAQKDMRVDFSDSFYFDTDESCIKFTLRIAGDVIDSGYTNGNPYGTNVNKYPFVGNFSDTESKSSSSSSSSSE